MPGLRKLEPDDFKHMLVIEAECFGSGFSPYFIKMIPYLFNNTSFISMQGRSAQGYVVAALEQSNPRRAWLLTLAVRPKYREQGLGKKLAATALDALAREGVAEVSLTVSSDNDQALALYKDLGFSVEKEIEDFYGPEEHRLVLKKFLSE